MMKVCISPSSLGDSSLHQILASYVVNDTVSIDGGVLGLLSPLEIQRRIQHVFLSHSHLDHLATLPLFIDNVYSLGPECPTVWAAADVLDVLQKHLFNDRIWPDMLRLSEEESPFLRMNPLSAEQAVEVNGLKVTPIPVHHVVPTFGFLVEEIASGSSVLFVSDTGPTDRIWEIANLAPGLKAVFLECSFPNSLRWLAEKAMHLTPDLFRGELAKLHRPVPVYVIHVKLAFETQILAELADLGIPDLHIPEPGKVLEFS
jgi:cAMP phosphodiesterase